MSDLSIQNPLVTIYIPTYNRVELLKRAVQSVRNQTYQNIEIIIVDDCSTDATHDYLKKISTQDKRIHYFLKDKNSGACISRNIAIENAKGKFITGLDDDDYFKKDRIELFLEKWNSKNSKTKFLYSLYGRKTNTGESKEISSFRKKLIKNKVNARDLLYFFYTGNQIFTETELFKKNLFDINMPIWQDFECYYRFLKENNCLGELLPIETYVVDISHLHERISTKKIGNLYQAFIFFKKKHNLTKTDVNLLECHLFNYPNVEVINSKVFRRFLHKPSLLDLKRLIGMKTK